MTREEAIKRVRTILSAGWGPENNEAIRSALKDMEAMSVFVRLAEMGVTPEQARAEIEGWIEKAGELLEEAHRLKSPPAASEPGGGELSQYAKCLTAGCVRWYGHSGDCSVNHGTECGGPGACLECS